MRGRRWGWSSPEAAHQHKSMLGLEGGESRDAQSASAIHGRSHFEFQRPKHTGTVSSGRREAVAGAPRTASLGSRIECRRTQGRTGTNEGRGAGRHSVQAANRRRGAFGPCVKLSARRAHRTRLSLSSRHARLRDLRIDSSGPSAPSTLPQNDQQPALGSLRRRAVRLWAASRLSHGTTCRSVDQTCNAVARSLPVDGRGAAWIDSLLPDGAGTHASVAARARPPPGT
jgi:hypothetical protein